VSNVLIWTPDNMKMAPGIVILVLDVLIGITNSWASMNELINPDTPGTRVVRFLSIKLMIDGFDLHDIQVVAKSERNPFSFTTWCYLWSSIISTAILVLCSKIVVGGAICCVMIGVSCAIIVIISSS
jgi:hypothetical protein